MSMLAPWQLFRARQPSSRIVMAVAVLSLIAGIALIGKSAAIYAKAILAQYLLEDAFAESLATGQPVKPWSWADSWPIARLEVPRLGASTIVMEGGSGEALAFGPGHLEATPKPGEPGASVISAHRDTHFRFLRNVRPGDDIRVTRRDGAIYVFRITEMNVVRWDASGIDPQEAGYWLVLSTCWPLDAVTPGELRYIVRAKLIGRQINSPAAAS